MKRVEVEMGDVNADRVINSVDFSQIKGSLVEQDLSFDLDLNGTMNSRDIVLFLMTLSERYDEDI